MAHIQPKQDNNITKPMKNENIFKQAVDHFGVENQLLKLVEEMAELTQAIIKRRLYPEQSEYYYSLLEEFTDVNLVMAQIVESELFKSKIAKELSNTWREQKLERLKKLLETPELTKDKI